MVIQEIETQVFKIVAYSDAMIFRIAEPIMVGL